MLKTKFLIFATLLFALLPICVKAETRAERDSLRHEIRIGWGDQMFESLTWQVTSPVAVLPQSSYLNPEEFRQVHSEQYVYTQHWFAEYQYRVNHWFGAGLMVDGSGVLWKDVVRDGYGNEISHTDHNFYNILILPSARFTYYNQKYVSLYSSVGLGLDINGGTETNMWGKKTDYSFACSIALLGVSANYQRWFWTLEYGGTYALKNQNEVFLLKSRMFTLSFGVRL